MQATAVHRWLSRLVRWLVAATLLPIAASAGQPLPAAASGSLDARAWLMRIHAAASQRNYQGTLVLSAGGAVSSSRVAHYREGQQNLERIDVLDGQARLIYRHNDQVLTLWPAAKVAQLDQRNAVAPFPALLSGSEEQLLERYEIKPEGSERIAGHDAQVFLLRPRDNLRFAQRLWAEKDSGLLLRSDVLSPDGRVLETAAFSDVAIGIKPQPETVLQPMKRLDGYRVVRSTLTRSQLDAEGWALKVPVAGFRQISCVKRPLDAAGDGERSAPVEVLQSIFSDGLTHVSVFIEPYRADRHRAVAAAIGATHTLTQAMGPWWITVMGDVPLATLQQFAAALERRR